MSPEPARHLLDAALAEWAAGRFYEAHELLEDFAECFEAEDQAFEWALGLTRVAASLHKLVAGVGVRAVPGKLHQALRDLAGAPPDWFDLDLVAFRSELAVLAERLQAGTAVRFLPSEMPVPRTIAAGPEGG